MAHARTHLDASPPLQFSVDDGGRQSWFYRDANVAAQVVVSRGAVPRLIVAFCAGDSAVAAWFDAGGVPLDWRLRAAPRPLSTRDARGRVLHGLQFEIEARVASLRVIRAQLGSARTAREVQAGAEPAPLLRAPVSREGAALCWRRDRIDGAAGYALHLEAIEGTAHPHGDGGRLDAAPGAPSLRLRCSAFSGEVPLVPLSRRELLRDPEGADPALARVLEFLCFREAWLAGSWRFHTHFGRDTLLALRLLMPVLNAEAIEAALSSVLARLSAHGEVAHEEEVGEFARLAGGASRLDYKMVDDDFLLAPVFAAYALDSRRGRRRASRFLAAACGDTTHADRLRRNARRVLAKAAAFAREPHPRHLIALDARHAVGDWRDSEDGLGGGRMPYGVNVALVPAALRAIDAAWRAGFLPEVPEAVEAGAMAAVWQANAPPLFDCPIDAATARAALRAHAAHEGIEIGADEPATALRFDALALDAKGRPIPVMNSDLGFWLLFGEPPAAELERLLPPLMRRYPAGLMTDAGLLIANPTWLEDAAARRRFGRDRYHGAVVWSWQQAMFAAGLERQLRRADLGAPARAALRGAQTALWAAIRHGRAHAQHELWSWRFEHGRFVAAPFADLSDGVDESNAAQLWSTVYLAVKEPAA